MLCPYKVKSREYDVQRLQVKRDRFQRKRDADGRRELGDGDAPQTFVDAEQQTGRSFLHIRV